MDRSGVAIVIPALNEAASIEHVVSMCAAAGRVIVVDDGSTDATATAAKRAGAIVCSHPANRGYDEALNTGFQRASALGCAIVVTLDADGQHNPRLLGAILDHVLQGADVVIGTRDRRPRIAESLFALYTRMRFGIVDPLCGLKAYRIGVYRDLGHFDSRGSIGTELALFAARRGYRIAQMPFKVANRADTPRFGRTLRANLLILRALVGSIRHG